MPPVNPDAVVLLNDAARAAAVLISLIRDLRQHVLEQCGWQAGDLEGLAGTSLVDVVWHLPLTDADRMRLADALVRGDEATIRVIGEETMARFPSCAPCARVPGSPSEDGAAPGESQEQPT